MDQNRYLALLEALLDAREALANPDEAVYFLRNIERTLEIELVLMETEDAVGDNEEEVTGYWDS